MSILNTFAIYTVFVFNKITERFGLIKVCWVSMAVVMLLFGDTLIPAIFHVLHVIWEVIESIIEHFLEATFHLSPKQSEFIVAWMGILSLTGAGLKLLYVAYRQALVLFAMLQQYLSNVKAELDANPYKMSLLLGIVSLGTYGASFLLF